MPVNPIADHLTSAERELLTYATRLCPDLDPVQVMYRSRTSLVLAGTLDGAAVVAKIRTPDWRKHSVREIETYECFAATQLPVAVPRCFGADPEYGVLVLEKLDGEVIAPDRFPAVPVSERDLTGVLSAVDRLRHWHPEVPRSWQIDYQSRFAGIKAQDLFRDADWTAVACLLERSGEPREFGHGDLVMANVMRTETGYALIDWASSALYLPGFDLAQLWLLLEETPGARERVEAVVAAREDAPRDRESFLLNLTMLLYREQRAHGRLTDDVSRARAVRLEASWEQVLEQVRRCAADPR